MSVFRRRARSVLLFTCVLTLFPGILNLAVAEPGAHGVVPLRVGKYEEARKICNMGNIPMPSWFAELLTLGRSKDCHESLDHIEGAFRNSYLRAESKQTSPGFPTNDVHVWQGVLIQDFRGSAWGDGWGAIIAPGPSAKSSHYPYYVGGGTWTAYKWAVHEKGIVPGYPTSELVSWAGIPLQFFEGGSWGNGAIIGGDNAWLVTGNHWERYWKEDGWASLGRPLGFVYKNSDNKYQQDFEKGNITELAGETWVHKNPAPQETTPKELPAVGRQEPTPTPKPAATCNDAGRPVLTSNLSALPSNPDTKTPVKFSFTIRNDGCGTFAPQKMMIAGRDPSNNVSDPTQRDNFRLAPGESYTFDHTATLKQPGTHKFWVAYMDWTNNWPKVPNTSGQMLEVHITVIPAPPDPTPVPTAVPAVETEALTEQPDVTPETSEPASEEPAVIESSDADSESVPQEPESPAVQEVESDTPANPDVAGNAAVCTEGAMPTFRDASAGLQEADRGPGAVPIKIEIVNSGCSLFEADSLEIYDDSPNGTSNLLMSIGSFGLESGGEWVIHQEFILTDPGEHQIRVVAVREGVTSHLLVESDSDDITFQSETRDYFSIHVSGSETVPTQPSQIQPVDIEPDGSGPVTTSTTNTIPSAPSPTEVVGCDMVWDGQKWVVESC